MFNLDRLEKRLEVAIAETAAALTLDHLDESGGPILDRARKDLQQLPLIVAVDQDSKIPNRLQGFLNRAYAPGEDVVIAVGNS